LDVETNHHPKPDRGDIGGGIGEQDGCGDWHHHHGDFDEIKKEAHEEDDPHHNNELHPKTAGQAVEEFPDKVLTSKRPEGGGQHCGSQQDDEDQRGGLRGFHHHALQGVVDLVGSPAAPAEGNQQQDHRKHGEGHHHPIGAGLDVFDVDLKIRQQDANDGQRSEREECRIVGALLALHETVAPHEKRTRRTDGPRLIHRRNPGDDRPQHEDDQSQRRDENEKHLEEEFCIKRLVVVDCRCMMGPEQGVTQDKRHVESHQHQTRNEGAEEHFSGTRGGNVKLGGHGKLARRDLVERLAGGAGLIRRTGQLVGEDDEDDGGRDDLAECSGSGNGSGRQGMRVVVAQHHRERNQAHRHDRCPDNARGCGQQGTDKNHGNAESSGNRTKELGHRHQQVFRDAGALEHDAHEDEEGNGDEGVAFDLPVNAPQVGDSCAEPLSGTALRKVHVNVAFEQITRDGGKADGDHRRAGQGKRHGKAGPEGEGHQEDKESEKYEFHEMTTRT